MNLSGSNESTNLAGLFGSDAAAESLRVIAKLNDAGHVAYLAGGCVRDALLGRTPKDFDVATNATPQSVRELFGKHKTLAFGASFGVIAVLPPRSSRDHDVGAITPTEVATFRSDGDYSDGRRPDSVQFGTAKEDALRRDFTINGMFYDPQTQLVIDFVGGQQDLQSRLLRTIGDPFARFAEDKLRMLRAVRFATILGLDVHESTLTAIRQNASEMKVVSGERIGAEMRKVLVSDRVSDGLCLLQDCQLASFVLPEIDDTTVQSIGGYFTGLCERNVSTVLACLLISRGLPSKTVGKIGDRWKLSNEEQRQAVSAVVHARDLLQAGTRPWSQIQPILIHRDVTAIVAVAQAVATAEDVSMAGVQFAKKALGWPSEKLDPPPLLTGDDLQQHAFPRGPIFRTILTEIRRAQLDNEISAPAEALVKAKQMIEENATQ